MKLLFPLLALVACPKRAPTAGSANNASSVQSPEWAPPPHTTEALRAAFPPGTILRFHTLREQQPPTEERWSVLHLTEHGTSLREEVFSPSGERIEDRGVDFLTWRAWRERSQLPAAVTTLESSSVSVASGSFDTWLYTTTEGSTVQRFHYAKTLPGPPVLSTVAVDGVEVSRMELLERRIDPEFAKRAYVQPAIARRWRPTLAEGLKSDAPGGVSCAVEVWIDQSGVVVGAQAERCAPGWAEASVAAAKNFAFTPATLDGSPLPSTFRLVFKYKAGS